MRSVFLIVLFVAFLQAQFVDPFLQKEISGPQMQKGGSTLHLLVEGSASFLDALEQKGFRVQTRTPQTATVLVPGARLQELLSMKGLDKVIQKPKAKLHNSRAVLYQNVDAAYAKGYTGSGVIIGVVDTGIDFYNPMFLKADGTTRILSIWDQTISGTKPGGYDYGAEFTETQINQDLASGSPYSIVTQKDTEGHGTHVAGSAAGRHLTTTPADTLHGGSMNSNLIIVKTSLSTSDIIDGVNYIFTKAAALGKPCVINLSVGSQYGPHDGTDPDVQSVDALTGPGKIVVRSAGNDGGSAVHYYAENVASTISLQFGYAQYITLWLEKGDAMQSASLTWPGGSITDVPKNGHKSSNGVDVYVQLAAASDNGKESVIIFMDNDDLSSETFTLTLNNVSDANGNNKIGRHAWSEKGNMSNPYGAFSQGSSYSSSHYPYTLANDACGNDIIAVGAFKSRKYWDASDGNTYVYSNTGEEGGIGSFSAIGPTASGGQKPDIIAGGTIVLSARSSEAAFQNALLPPAPYTDYFAYMQGTSMAAPVAAGAIALLLEKHPSWTPADVMNYIKNNAQGTSRPAGTTEDQVKVKDDPGTWDRVFGYGAIDLEPEFSGVGIEETDGVPPKGFALEQNYPNPFNPCTEIHYTVGEDRSSSRKQVELSVYNALGQKVATLVNQLQQAGTYSVIFNAAGLSSGVYFYKIRAGSFTRVKKMIYLR